MSVANGIANAITFANRKCESYGRTDGRTNEEVTNPPLNPSPPYRARAYNRFEVLTEKRHSA